MKKKNFKVKKFDGSEKTHEVKRDDLITQYKRMSSIAYDIYNSDFFAMATKKEQKEIEASVACITRTLVSMIGLDAIDRSYFHYFPDDSGNDNDHSLDNLPNDSGDYTDTDKASHDAIEKMKNIAYDKTESDGVKKVTARQVLNSVYGATHPIMAMNRKILSELGTKSPLQKLVEDPPFSPLLRSIALGNESDDDSDGDEVKDYSEVNLGNFISGSFYSDQYRALAIQYGFDMNDTMKQIEKMASQYCIQMINLVDIVDSQNEITADKYTLEPGSVFFVTNKNDESRSPVFMLIYAQPYTKVRSSDISKFSFEIAPAEVEESTKTNDIEFINSDAYFNIGKVQLSPNTIIDLDATLTKIKDEARVHDIDTITFVDTIGNSLDIYTKGKYTLEPGSLFCHRGNGWLNFMLILKDKNTPDTVRFIWPVEKSEENASQDDIEFVGADAYYKIDNAYPSMLTQNSTTIDLDATLARIKERARAKNIKTITFVGIVKDHLEIFYKCKYYQAGSFFYIRTNERPMFIMITGTIDYVYLPQYEHIDPVVVFKKDDSDEDSSDSNYESGSHDVVDAEVEFEYTPYKSRYINDLATSFMAKDDIEFIGADAYYKIDKAYPDSDQVIDLDATLIKIKEKAKEKGVKTITFMDTIDENGNHTSDTFSYEPGALFFVKNTKWVRFELITRTDFTMFYHIYPVLTYESSYKYSVNDQYADVDTSKLNHDIYAGVSFPIFMKPTVTGANVSFADICDIYGFDTSETIKRIKNAAYLENIDEVNYIDSFNSFDEIFKIDLPTRYRYCDGYLFFVNDSAKDKQDPCFVILRKTRDNSEIDAILYRINPIKRPASIYCIKKIDVIDTYADGDVRIADGLKNTIDIDHAYKLKEICDKRNYNYDSIISCLKGVTAIIGGGTCLTFEGTVDSLNSIVSVDPVVAYNACSVFFVSGFVDSEKGPYFVIYMPITGKTKNGYSFHLYRIYPILNQDPNTDSQDDSNAREINQFTTIYRANLEVSEADKDAYMKVEFSNIDYNDREIQSLANICYTWKFKFYDTIKRIRFVAYMSNFEEIKYAGTACSHEEILEKEVLYSNGSVLFVSDTEDPHFVIVEFIHGSTCLIRINPVKE